MDRVENSGTNVKGLAPEGDTLSETIGALRRYLEDLKETGVDALPFAPAAENFPVQQPATPPLAVEAAGSAEMLREVSEPAVETLDGIRAELDGCGRCALGETRTNLVFGTGSAAARVVFVGEGPGAEEDLQGVPFVGEAGQLLTKIIQAMGFSRDEVYICNVVKCRPPANRNPLPEEIEACQPYLLRQLRTIRAEAIIALGTFAAQTLLATKEPISRLRGRFHDYHGIPLMPTFHPAFLLRNAERKKEVWSDVQQVMRLLGKEIPKKEK